MAKRVRPALAIAALVPLMMAVGGCFLFPNRPPEAAFTVVYDVTDDPMVIDLDASASTDPDNDVITAYQWAFSDDLGIVQPEAYSKLVTTPSLCVRCPVEGEYTVQLVVWDDHGNPSAPVSNTVVVPNPSVQPMP